MTSEEPTSIGDLKQVPHTPTMQQLSVAEAYDLQGRVSNAERELLIERNKLARETRKNRRLQQQIHEYTEALAQTVQDCSMTRYHFDLVSSSHLALSQEYQKAKLMVETLEAVIRMLHNPLPPPLNSDSKGTMASEEQLPADQRD